MRKFLASPVFAVISGLVGGVCAYFLSGKSLILTIWTGGLPVVFRIFDKKIDAFLAPIQGVKSKIPKLILFILGLAFPLLVSFLITNWVYDVQLAVLLTTIISPFVSLIVTKPPKKAPVAAKALAASLCMLVMFIPLALFSQSLPPTDWENVLANRREADKENDNYSKLFQRFVISSKVEKSYYDREKQENVLIINAVLRSENDDYYGNRYTAVLVLFQNGKSLGRQNGDLVKEERLTPEGERNARFKQTIKYTIRVKPEDSRDMYVIAWHFLGNNGNVYGMIRYEYRAVFSEPAFRERFLAGLFSLLLTGLITLPQLLLLLQKQGFTDEQIAKVQDDFAKKRKKGQDTKYRKLGKAELDNEAAFYKKVTDWLSNHPEYSRLRSKIINDQGFVDRDFFKRVTGHYQKHKDDIPASEFDTPYWIKQGFAGLGRELFTGVTVDGSTGIASLVLRGLAGAASGGVSEWVYNTADACYKIKDAADKDLSGIDLYLDVGLDVVKDAVTGLASGKVINKGLEYGSSVNKAIFQKPLVPRTNVKIALDVDEAALLKKTLDTIEQGDSKELVKLYKNRPTLAAIEAKGHLPQDKVNILVKKVKQEVNSAIDEASKKTFRELGEKAGAKGEYNFKGNKVIAREDFKVTVDELHRADFGRNAKNSYVDFDVDNTTFAGFKPGDIAMLQKKLVFLDKNGTPYTPAHKDVHDFLQSRTSSIQEQNVKELLKSKLDIDAKDIEYGNYAGTKGVATASDTYPTAITENSIARTQGSQIYSLKGGEVHTVKTSGRTLIDEQNLAVKKVADLDKIKNTDLSDNALKIAKSEWKDYLEQQRKAIFEKALDPHKYPKVELQIKPLTKAIARMHEVAKVNKNPLPDQRLVDICSQVRKNTNQLATILENNGYPGTKGMQDFVGAVGKMAEQYLK